MSDASTYDRRRAKLNASLEKRLGLKNKAFEARLRRAMRRFPKRERHAARAILTAGEKMQHPKLARLIDPATLDAEFDRVERHVATIDLAEERMTRVLGMLGALSFNLILLALGVIALLRWQGMI
jgi:hypothetical protein